MKFKDPSCHHMFFFSFLFSALCLVSSCTSAKNQPETTTENSTGNIPFDTIQKARIDSIINSINSGLREIGPPQKLPFPLETTTDTIFYWILRDGKSARISIDWRLPNEERWPVFYISDDELVFTRYRHMIDSPPNSKASESLIYINDGKIVYCEERGGPLKEGEKPMAIQMRGFTKSTRPYAEIEKDFKENWELVYDFMKKNNVLPASFKK